MMQPLSFLVINGPNLNLLGLREPGIYGELSIETIEDRVRSHVNASIGEMHKRHRLTFLQSNHEGALIDAIQNAHGTHDGLIINAGGYSHTSVALRDSIAAVKEPAAGKKPLPTVEVHISNVYARESFRHMSLLAPVCIGSISGLGWFGYAAAIDALKFYSQRQMF
jgi:3-dehydroquinate dehydratase-2